MTSFTRTAVFALILAGCSEPMPPTHSPEHAHDHHDHYEHAFKNAEAWAKEFDDPARDAWQKPASVVALMGVKPGMVVADVGTGTGYFLPYLDRAVGIGGKVLALDVEADMIRYVKERVAKEKLATVEARVVAPDDPALLPSSVDRVLIVDTWHHIGDRSHYSKKLYDALKPGGEVVVVDFTAEAPKGPPKEHRIPPAQVVSELAGAGLAASIVEEDLPDQYVVIGTRK